jgi:hypothetical protein
VIERGKCRHLVTSEIDNPKSKIINHQSAGSAAPLRRLPSAADPLHPAAG